MFAGKINETCNAIDFFVSKRRLWQGVMGARITPQTFFGCCNVARKEIAYPEGSIKFSLHLPFRREPHEKVLLTFRSNGTSEDNAEIELQCKLEMLKWPGKFNCERST